MVYHLFHFLCSLLIRGIFSYKTHEEGLKTFSFIWNRFRDNNPDKMQTALYWLQVCGGRTGGGREREREGRRERGREGREREREGGRGREGGREEGRGERERGRVGESVREKEGESVYYCWNQQSTYM